MFNKVLATKEVFPSVIKIAKFLGPKGLMPSPARGTVSDDVEGMMKSLKATTKYEMESGTGLIHLEVAKVQKSYSFFLLIFWNRQDGVMKRLLGI